MLQTCDVNGPVNGFVTVSQPGAVIVHTGAIRARILRLGGLSPGHRERGARVYIGVWGRAPNGGPGGTAPSGRSGGQSPPPLKLKAL